MLLPLHMTLLTVGLLFLIVQNFVWNTSLLAIGILACLMAFFSVFVDPTLLIFM
jgi:hypothetical protein